MAVNRVAVLGPMFLLCTTVAVCGCWLGGGQSGTPDGGDVDSDSDTDADGDTDTDADTDTDTDTDTEFTCEGVLHFPDPNFELSVCLSLGIFDNTTDTCTADILAEDVAEITYFVSIASVAYVSAPEHYITDLTGLECMPNLITVKIEGNYSSFDLSPLAGASALEALYAGENQIDDLSPLAGLTQLFYLDLYHNEISDVSPLSGLTQLIGLVLSRNLISDVSPLSSLNNLDSLSLSKNEISDIDPLASLTGLWSLGLRENDISYIDAVASMTGLDTIYFWMNNVTDLTPLVNNASFADGCYADFTDNPIDCDDQAANIATLKDRGVHLVCDCSACD